MEPTSILAVIGGAAVGKKTIEKILGPTADYVGEGLRGWSERRVTNVRTILSIAERFLKDVIDSPGAVPPKVLKEVLEEGSFNDDPLALEYYGGVLASSRTPISRDDRGASMMRLVADLTTYQLRTHYIFYAATRRVFGSTGRSLANPNNREACRMYLSLDAYYKAMDLGAAEDLGSILGHATFGLAQHGLIDQAFQFGARDVMMKHYPNLKVGGICFMPSARGTELFLWANGLGGSPYEDFLLADTPIVEQSGIVLETGFWSLADANQTAGT